MGLPQNPYRIPTAWGLGGYVFVGFWGQGLGDLVPEIHCEI